VKSILFNGGAGDDSFTNNTAIRSIAHGGAGNDHLTGGRGKDLLEGDAGNDVLDGRSGDDVLDGGAGNDHLNGDDGHDVLRGGPGRDVGQNDDGDVSSGMEFEGIGIELSALAGGQVRGEAEFQAQGNALTALRLEVEHARANQALSILVGSTQVGQITTDARGKGEVILTTFANPVTVQDGTTLTVQDGNGQVLLSGVFSLTGTTGDDHGHHGHHDG
jgi:Ca2+-binding RTX toxin-like protein